MFARAFGSHFRAFLREFRDNFRNFRNIHPVPGDAKESSAPCGPVIARNCNSSAQLARANTPRVRGPASGRGRLVCGAVKERWGGDVGGFRAVAVLKRFALAQ